MDKHDQECRLQNAMRLMKIAKNPAFQRKIDEFTMLGNNDMANNLREITDHLEGVANQLIDTAIDKQMSDRLLKKSFNNLKRLLDEIPDQ